MICFIFKPRRRVAGRVRESRFYSGKIRMDWDSRPEIVALKTTDKREALRLLTENRIKREKRHHGLLPPEEHEDARQKPLAALLEAFLADLKSEGRTETTLKKYANLRVLFSRCGWVRLPDVTERSFCDWRARSPLAPKSKSDLLKNTRAFLNWMRRRRMLRENPLEFVRDVDNRRTEHFRRALSEDEIRRLLAAAPHERAVVYLTALRTGLRHRELQEVTVADLALDSPAPVLRVRASIAKHPKDAYQRLTPDVVDAIRSVLPAAAHPARKVFEGMVPRVPTLKRDLAKAGIPFQDALGRRVDLHAMRHTFGTQLAAAGVPPFILKELMRHSSVRESEKYYIDGTQVPTAAAVAVLPRFDLPNNRLMECSESSKDGRGGRPSLDLKEDSTCPRCAVQRACETSEKKVVAGAILTGFDARHADPCV